MVKGLHGDLNIMVGQGSYVTTSSRKRNPPIHN